MAEAGTPEPGPAAQPGPGADRPPAEIETLTAAVAALRGGDRSVPAYARDVCERIDGTERVVRAFVPEPGRHDRTRTAAERIARTWPDPAAGPPLFGVAVGVKDIVRVDGLATRAGSRLPPELFDGPQASVVNRLVDAGAFVAGKTATAEFAGSAPGPTRNPHDPRHTPGGSSSGSAAAVAAGAVPLAIGTQTIGSVIRPAAYCGVTGFRPTFGRIPTDGVVPNAPTFDTVGLFTHDVPGAALAAGVLCDDWRPPPESPGLPVLGVPVGPLLERAGAEALEEFQGQIARLRRFGLDVRPLPVMADFDATVRDQRIVNRFELARAHAGWFSRYRDLYRAETAEAVLEGRAIGTEEYEAALRARELFRERIVTEMTDGGVDLWVTPAATGPAPLGLGTTGDPVMSLPWSTAGMPALGLPVRRSRRRLPLGLQCVAEPGADERLLAWGAVLEQVLNPGR